MFEYIKEAPSDPILGILDIFNADVRTNKINLGIGVYQNEHGNTPILNSVKKAESLILNCETSKNYLSIEGMYDFIVCTQKLLFSVDSNGIIADHRICTVQTPGGTGAIRIAADFLAKNTTVKRVWISSPSWTNHKNIFVAAGLQVCYYSYYDPKLHNLSFDNMLMDLNHAGSDDIILLHACCHNPTGMDFSVEQWHILAKLSAQNGWLPLFDLAYQGFGVSLSGDVEGIRIFSNYNEELIICNSYSKNFGLYNERVGACTVVTANENDARHSLSQLKSVIRANYSNPPAHGAAIVTTILNSVNLKCMWEEELSNIRKHIKYLRQLFVCTLHDKCTKDFSFINRQQGMFSFIGLNQKQVLKLREKLGIYMTDSARINIAGITLKNISMICDSIVSVI
ncbi:amino acid aminotransferase [Blochmannia endosymbiont of Camponotus (Colobopsis) obliquus]|uniref:amino acid aminotransferase n=1 Tax=Blochmannia endosymbiont of Camponotus (Colobopsis) obliquus TaxID=1505597 RepID=UPI00061A6468|nr:amino acid aminotransferase [Blochmannia endosymbiont of Camponotus (Colobopsis) obliquus]AKC60576.1 aspartate aminotransferase [Blochmannia endosymbiont of Camponotus (Colobopsis) obliquus]